MLKKESVTIEMYNIIKELQNNILFENHILAGGTGIALQLGHRTSTDIDLFTYNKQNSVALTEYFRKNYKNYVEDIVSDAFTRVYINKIKIELIHDDENKIVNNPLIEDGIKYFNIKEISAMKIKAIQGRTEARDFIDLAYLLKEMPLKDMFEIYKGKYGSISELMMKRTIKYKCENIKENEWLIDIKMLREDIKPENILGCIEKGIDNYEKKIGKHVYDRINA